MKASELSLRSMVWYLNPKTGQGGGTTINSISRSEDTNMPHELGKLKIVIHEERRTLYCNPDDETITADTIDYYFNEIDWQKQILPFREKRVEELTCTLSCAKEYLRETKEKLKNYGG